MRAEAYIFIFSIIIFCIALFIGARYVADTSRAAREYKKKYDTERKKIKKIINKLQSSTLRERQRNDRNRKYNTELADVTKTTTEDIKKISSIIKEGADSYNNCRCDCGSVVNNNNIASRISPNTKNKVKK